MNPEDMAACETPVEDHIACLIEYLRKPDARLNVAGETWSMCWGVGDKLNGLLADHLERWPRPLPWDAGSNYGYEPVETLAKEIYDFFEYRGSGTKPPWVPGGNSLMQDEARMCARRQLRKDGHTPSISKGDRA